MIRGQDEERQVPKDRGLREYRLPGGWVAIAGRTDADNDELSLRLARPNDLWFHVRGVPGSHVILRVNEGEEPGRDVIKAAAAIAAYHSKARKAGVVAVSCTRARFVSKARGAGPGTVSIRREELVKVRPGLPAPEEPSEEPRCEESPEESP